MNNLLLTTKLRSPILRKDIVHRPRLVDLLNEGLWQEEGFARKLTLVSAAAGSGKTTLIGEWLRGGKFQAAWLSLDESDNDPARFLAYLVAALRQLQSDFGGSVSALLQAPQVPAEVILTALVNDLAAFHSPVILALDDYHAIHIPAIHQQITFILTNQPANLHLVILTREDPLLPVSRLRARRQLLEIRQDDLRFTRDEIAEFLQRGEGLSLPSSGLAALERHTEGWAAGLQLAALSLRGRENLNEFLHDFAGSERYILDYLVEEVFTRQPAEVQDFLLRTSILNRLSGPLCDAVTGQNGSTEILRGLEQANLFILPLDLSRDWYRYHHLFAELLHQRLRQSGISEADLRRRASQWYETQGFFQEAVEQTLAAQDWGNVARLVGMINEGMFKRGEVVTLLNWFQKIPQLVTYSSPTLCLVNAWAALLASQFEIAAPLLAHAEEMAEPNSYFMGQVASALAFLARAKRDDARAIQQSEKALALLPEADITVRGNIAMNLGLAYWHEGRITEAESVLAQACDTCGRGGNLFGLLTAQVFLARAAAVRGKLRQAAAMLEKLLQVSGPVPILCLAYFDLATLYIEWNDLSKAAHHLEQGMALAQRSGNLEFQQSGILLRAILAHAQGEEERALAALDEAHALARDFPSKVRSRAAAFGVQLALSRGDANLLAHWTSQVQAEVDAHSFYRFMGLTRPRLWIAQGEKAQAAGALKILSEAAERGGWGYGLLAVRILQSLAANSAGEAVQFLADALRLGQAEGFMRSFIDAGRGIIPLLQEAAHQGAAPGYAGQILTALGVEGHQASPILENLAEPLSEREIEVLRLVTAGLSNREIAVMLVISLGTAKTHIHNLCGKLGVRNRTEAAMRARELNLV